jgi:flagellar biosynthesis anti-sigma factor FlgM
VIIRDNGPLNGAGRVNNPYLKTLQTGDRTQREGAARETAASERDEVGISPEAMARQQAVRKAQAALSGGEDVRWDKVNELRQRVARGEYRVAPDRLAQRLLGES